MGEGLCVDGEEGEDSRSLQERRSHAVWTTIVCGEEQGGMRHRRSQRQRHTERNRYRETQKDREETVS